MNRVAKYLGVFLWALMLCAACGGHHQPIEHSHTSDSIGEKLDSDDTENIDAVIYSNRKLQYLFFANGGLIGFFSDSTVSGCPKCDLCFENINYLVRVKPMGRFVKVDSFLIRLHGVHRDTMVVGKSDVSYEGWAMIGAKWKMKIDSCK